MLYTLLNTQQTCFLEMAGHFDGHIAHKHTASSPGTPEHCLHERIPSSVDTYHRSFKSYLAESKRPPLRQWKCVWGCVITGNAKCDYSSATEYGCHWNKDDASAARHLRRWKKTKCSTLTDCVGLISVESCCMWVALADVPSLDPPRSFCKQLKALSMPWARICKQLSRCTYT